MVNPLFRLPYVGQPLSNNTRQNLILPSGAIQLLPAGDFYVQLGRQAILQYYDSSDGGWHSYVGGPTQQPFYCGSDATNYRVINVSGTVQGVSMTNNGSAYTAAPAVAFGAPASGITATGIAIVGGDLTFSVAAGGSGYVNPVVMVAQPPLSNGNAIPAVATTTVSGGTITAVTLSSGCGYLTAPTVTVVDPAGTLATIVASIGTTNAQKVLAVRITNPGSGYDGTHIPSVTFTGGGGSSAAGTAMMSMAISSLTVTSAGGGFTVAPILMTDGGVVATGVNGESYPFRPAILSTTTGSGTIATGVVEDEGFGFQKVPTVVAISSSNAPSSTAPTLTAVVGGVNTAVSLWQLG